MDEIMLNDSNRPINILCLFYFVLARFLWKQEFPHPKSLGTRMQESLLNGIEEEGDFIKATKKNGFIVWDNAEHPVESTTSRENWMTGIEADLLEVHVAEIGTIQAVEQHSLEQRGRTINIISSYDHVKNDEFLWDKNMIDANNGFSPFQADSSPRRQQSNGDSGDDDAASLALARQLQEYDIMAHHTMVQLRKKRYEQELLRLQIQFVDHLVKTQERLSIAKRQHEEEQQMNTTVIGRAWKFVEKVLALDKAIKQRHQIPTSMAAVTSKVSAIAKDDMVFLAANMFRQQDAFRGAGKPIQVDLGFHYTRPDNLSRIRTDGLLSKAEREGWNISSFHHGSLYGDGIYTSDDHSLGGCSGAYGDIGIIVARLKGTEKIDTSFSGDQDCNQCHSRAITVLKTSAQCLALVEFHRSVIFPTTTTTAPAAPLALFGPAGQGQSTASSPTMPAALQSQSASHSGAVQAVALNAAARTASHHPPTTISIPAVMSGIIGEYHRELQQIVEEAFNKRTTS